MSEPKEKLCIWCKHCVISMAEEGWSEWTPGSNFDISCRQDKWRFEPYGDESNFRKCIVAAKDCDAYEFNERLSEEAQ